MPWALEAEEGRDKRRNALGSCGKRRSRDVRMGEPIRLVPVLLSVKDSRKRRSELETSKQPQEEKAKRLPLVAASETADRANRRVYRGCRTMWT